MLTPIALGAGSFSAVLAYQLARGRQRARRVLRYAGVRQPGQPWRERLRALRPEARRKGRRHRLQIDAVLPDTLDLLTACSEAGLGLDAAIARLAQRRSPSSAAMDHELRRYLQDLQAGAARADALRALAARSGSEDLHGVVHALLQADTLGVGVAQVLRAQARFLRDRRKQRAEERAMKAPIKLLFPLVFGVFPALFVVLLGPAVLRLLDTLLR